jgi:apolipoprotein N-acyltransferase
MELPVNQLLELFGIELQSFLFIAGITYLVVELFKKKVGAGFLFGYRVDILAVLIAFGLAYKTIMPKTGDQWWSVAIVAIVCWLAPAGINAARKNVKK